MRGDSQDVSQYNEDLKSFGLDEELSEPERNDFELFPENWPAFCVFVGCSTQWRMSDGQPVGLDYTAVESVMRVYKVKQARETFERIRVLESAALAEFIKRRKR